MTIRAIIPDSIAQITSQSTVHSSFSRFFESSYPLINSRFPRLLPSHIPVSMTEPIMKLLQSGRHN